jgi:hypothetical protein
MPRHERSVAPDHHHEETTTMADRNSTAPRQATSQTTEVDARIAALTQELTVAHEQIARLEAAAAQARAQLPPNKTVTELSRQIKQLYAELPHLCPDEDRQ